MIKKVPIAQLTLLIDKTYSLLQLSNQLSSYGKQAKLLLVEHQIETDFFQWTLSGNDWILKVHNGSISTNVSEVC